MMPELWCSTKYLYHNHILVLFVQRRLLPLFLPLWAPIFPAGLLRLRLLRLTASIHRRMRHERQQLGIHVALQSTERRSSDRLTDRQTDVPTTWLSTPRPVGTHFTFILCHDGLPLAQSEKSQQLSVVQRRRRYADLPGTQYNTFQNSTAAVSND